MIRAVLDHYGLFVPDRVGWQPVRCPFHDDEHTSASVCLYDGPQDVFVCHACGVKGNAIKLIMQQEEMEYRAAKQRAEELARDFGEVVQSDPVEGNRLPGRTWNPGGTGQRGATGLRGRPASRPRAV